MSFILNTSRIFLAGFGTSTSAIGAGGNPLTAKTEEWNGAAWVEVADLSAARGNHVATGTSTAGFVISGDNPPGRVTSTEEWSGSTNSTKTISTD